MSAFTPVTVRIIRKAKAIDPATMRPTERDEDVFAALVCRVYRANPRYRDNQGQAGRQTEERLVVSPKEPLAPDAIHQGDLIHLPSSCIGYAAICKVVRVRPYATSLQLDVELPTSKNVLPS